MLFIVLTSLFSVMRSTIIKFSSNGKKINILGFNAVQSLASVLLLFAIARFQFEFHTPTMIYGIVFAIFNLLCLVFDYLALSAGSMALTSLIVSYSVILPCAYGIIFLKEELSVLQAAGLILLLASMFFLNKREEDAAKGKKQWYLFVLLSFLCNGVASILGKMHQVAFPGSYVDEYNMVGNAVPFVVFTILALCSRAKQNAEKQPVTTAVKPLYALAAGVCIGLLRYCSLSLAATVNATILFPFITIFSAIFSVLASRILFKEIFSGKQIAGVCMGIVSVILMS